MRKHHVRPEKPKSTTETIPAMIKRTKAKINKSKLVNKFSVIAIGVAFAASGAYFIVNGSASTPAGTANLWIDAAGGTHNCQRQSTPEDYATALANSRTCSSMQAAVAASSNTTTTQVRMLAETYPGQTITTNKTQATQVTITAEAGTNLTGSLSTKGDWLTVENVSSKGAGFSDVGGGHPINVTWNNVDVSGGLIYLDGGTNFTWNGGAFHDNQTNNEGHLVLQGIPPNCPKDSTAPCSSDLNNAVIDGVRFYNLTRLSTCASVSCHNEVVRIDNGAHDITFRNNKFESSNDPNSAVVFTGDKSYGADEYNLTFEQNFFGSSGAAYYSLDVSKCVGLKVRFNTFAGSNANLSCTSGGTVVMKGNLGHHVGGCSVGGANTTWDHNVWSDAACGGTDVGGKTMSFADSAASDFHLTSGSIAAIDVAGLTGCPVTDIDGGARPIGAGCDAGADEYGSSGTTPPPPTPKPGDTNGDNVVNIIDLSTLLSKWNTNFPSADFNTDGTVGIVDLSVLLSNYSK